MNLTERSLVEPEAAVDERATPEYWDLLMTLIATWPRLPEQDTRDDPPCMF